MPRFENKCECGNPKVAGAIACSSCYAEARDRIAHLKDGSSVVVERVMRQFESALARRRAYGPPSTQ